MKIGVEIEGFLMSDSGRLIPAFQVLPDKEISIIHKFGSLSNDDFQFETRTEPFELEEFAVIMEGLIKETDKIINQLGYKTIYKPAVVFPKEEFFSYPEDRRRWGCNPDYNIWEQKIPKKVDGKRCPIRTAGLHLHIDCNHLEIYRIVKALDNLTLKLREQSPYKREEILRGNTGFGKLGTIRMKPYGIEYRAMSSQIYNFKELQNSLEEILVKKCVELEQ